ncbi:hypothetical protein [Aquamicrobium soli]|uniref:Uncharacterized protein n=1 Tax=Aquamicrobium soli TaxID=1811518 RepID=A0ABV7KJN9_9HYPH
MNDEVAGIIDDAPLSNSTCIRIPSSRSPRKGKLQRSTHETSDVRDYEYFRGSDGWDGDSKKMNGGGPHLGDFQRRQASLSILARITTERGKATYPDGN